jgi:hypothetical protein
LLSQCPPLPSGPPVKVTRNVGNKRFRVVRDDDDDDDDEKEEEDTEDVVMEYGEMRPLENSGVDPRFPVNLVTPVPPSPHMDLLLDLPIMAPGAADELVRMIGNF